MSSRNSRSSKTASTYATDFHRGSFPVDDGAGIPRSREPSEQSPADSRAGRSRLPILLPHEQIAERARALWLASGCQPGRDEQNWREAETQLQAESFLE